MTVREHYDKHLGNFYSWMAGDFQEKQKEFKDFLARHQIHPSKGSVAIDLGAGHGIQSVALATMGFKVIAIDFNRQLLNELKENARGLNIEVFHQDIQTVLQFAERQPDVIICWGDTLTHLESKENVEALMLDSYNALKQQGKLLLSLRDYSLELEGDKRFIPVKSDKQKILTCFLEYEPEYIRVTDLLYERMGEKWTQKVSSYKKIRIAPDKLSNMLTSIGYSIEFQQVIKGVITIIASKT